MNHVKKELPKEGKFSRDKFANQLSSLNLQHFEIVLPVVELFKLGEH